MLRIKALFGRTITGCADGGLRHAVWRGDFVVTGDGFLYNQVRSMVGTLLRVGMGAEPVEWVKTVLEAKDRTKAGANVPAKGLTLVEVKYDGKPKCRTAPSAAIATTSEEE